MKDRRFILLALASVAVTASAGSVTLTINGQPTTLTTTTVNGTPYVKLSDLQKALGTGGANQRSSVEGCMNEWLFNGIWRLRVTKVDVVTDPSRGNYPGYAVTTEIRNGTTGTITPDSAGLETNNDVSVALRDGDQQSYSYDTDWVDRTFAKYAQGSGFIFTFRMWPDPMQSVAQLRANMPTKFLLQVQNKLGSSVKGRFTVPDPSFRVDLTCTR